MSDDQLHCQMSVTAISCKMP